MITKKKELLTSHDKLNVYAGHVIEQELELLRSHDMIVSSVRAAEKIGFADPVKNRAVLMMSDSILIAENGFDLDDLSKILVESDKFLDDISLLYHESVAGAEYWMRLFKDPENPPSIKRLGVMRLTGFNALQRLIVSPTLVRGRA